jgi:hypothetical protein
MQTEFCYFAIRCVDTGKFAMKGGKPRLFARRCDASNARTGFANRETVEMIARVFA